jgi:tRNA A37 threonylcarbamoyladenosine synthetase subunit TsaC/SUA5/YrdC
VPTRRALAAVPAGGMRCALPTDTVPGVVGCAWQQH